jgi:Flp pilus assembly protein TadD
MRAKLCALLALAAAAASAAGLELDRARNLYNSTDFDGSLRLLRAMPVKDGAAYELIGRNYYMQHDFKQATEALEKALAADPGNSGYALWLGRAYGRRAEAAGPFTAPAYASKTRQYFEKAVQLDSRNLDALNDLLEYYLEAPGFLGGGLDKAAATAGRIAQVDAAEGHAAQARLAEKKKEYGAAEQSFRRAVESAPYQVSRLVDLARFLMRRGRDQEAEQTFAKAEKLAPNSPKLLYERAETYIRNGRNLDLARELLQRYMNSSLTADDPPRSDAQKLLRQ